MVVFSDLFVQGGVYQKPGHRNWRNQKVLFQTSLALLTPWLWERWWLVIGSWIRFASPSSSWRERHRAREKQDTLMNVPASEFKAGWICHTCGCYRDMPWGKKLWSQLDRVEEQGGTLGPGWPSQGVWGAVVHGLSESLICNRGSIILHSLIKMLKEQVCDVYLHSELLREKGHIAITRALIRCTHPAVRHSSESHDGH